MKWQYHKITSPTFKRHFRTTIYGLNMLVVFTLIFSAAGAKEDPTAQTQLGVIKGKSNVHTFRGREYTTNQFFGIPYAKPPVGPLRFQRPEPHEGFSSPYEATQFGSACPQNEMLIFGRPSREEDCLFLNIYVPTRKTDNPKGHAVMIFIHGGRFSVGSADMYNGETLCAYGNIIVVSINYRLGIFGFANTGDGNAKGNMGLWDQRLAIQWVNDHIAAFGGDSSRITIFGESSGSVSVFMQGMFPKNKGLFQNLIAESGSPTMPFGFKHDNLPGLSLVADRLGCSTDTVVSIYTCLHEASVESIMATIMKVSSSEDMAKVLFMPSLDDEYFLMSPSEAFYQQTENATDRVQFLRSLNLINGMNDAEGGISLLLTFEDVGDLDNFFLSHDDFNNGHLAGILRGITMGGPVPELLLNIVASAYRDWTNPANARDMFIKLMGDYFFNVPSVEISILHANDSSSKSWLYNYRAQHKKRLLPTPFWAAGANHADELMSVFGFAESDLFTAANLKGYVPQEWELDLAESVMTIWSNFAKHGTPGKDWPQYDVESQYYLIIDQQNSVGQYLHAKEMDLWRKIVPQIVAAEHSRPISSSSFVESSETCYADGH